MDPITCELPLPLLTLLENRRDTQHDDALLVTSLTVQRGVGCAGTISMARGRWPTKSCSPHRTNASSSGGRGQRRTIQERTAPLCYQIRSDGCGDSGWSRGEDRRHGAWGRGCSVDPMESRVLHYLVLVL